MPPGLPPPHIRAMPPRRRIASNMLRRAHEAGKVDHLARSCAGVAHHGNAAADHEQPGAGFRMPPTAATEIGVRCPIPPGEPHSCCLTRRLAVETRRERDCVRVL